MTALRQCVILNRNAGTAKKIEAGLHRLGPHTIFEATGPKSASQLAHRAVQEGYQLVIAAGGDGTLNEVVNGLASGFGRVQLGLLPMGTANDFAFGVNIPDELEGAIDVLLAGRTRKLDVVRVTLCDRNEPHYFINVSAGGFSAVVSERLDEETKSWWGPLGYVLSAVKSLPELTQYEVTLKIDDEPPATVPLYNLVVANSRYVGGHIPVAPRAEVDDGRFDLVLFRAVPATRLATLVPRAMLGQHVDDPDVAYRQARRVEISSDPPLEFNADGELVGRCPATFEVVPAALEVVVGTPTTE